MQNFKNFLKVWQRPYASTTAVTPPLTSYPTENTQSIPQYPNDTPEPIPEEYHYPDGPFNQESSHFDDSDQIVDCPACILQVTCGNGQLKVPLKSILGALGQRF